MSDEENRIPVTLLKKNGDTYIKVKDLLLLISLLRSNNDLSKVSSDKVINALESDLIKSL